MLEIKLVLSFVVNFGDKFLLSVVCLKMIFFGFFLVCIVKNVCV